MNINSRNLIRAFLLIIFMLTGIQKLQADNDHEFSVATPKDAIYSHLYFLQRDNYNPELAAQTIYSKNISENKAKDLTVKLIRILDGRGMFVNVEQLPDDPGYIDSISNTHRYVLFAQFPDIYLEKYDDEWLYSRHTVNYIPDMYREIFPFGLDRLITSLPKFMLYDFWGLELWQFLGILILFLISFMIYRIFSWIFGHFLTMIFARFGYKDMALKFIKPVARPLSLFFIIMIIRILTPSLQLPIGFGRYVMTTLNILSPVMVIIVLYRMVDLIGATFQRISAKAETTLDKQLQPLIRKAVKVVIVILGTLFILQNLDFNITTLLAGLSIGGLAFALAAQDTIKNLFGSILIFADKPFKVGEWISFGEFDGTVEEVGVRSTRVRTFYNSLIYIPNGRLADMAVDNYGAREFRRFFTRLAITYDTPPDLVEAFVEGLKKIVDNHPTTRKDFYEIHLNDLGDTSLQIMFYIFFKVDTWSDELKSRHEILVAVLNLAKQLGVRFAFPTQTLHIEEFPGKGTTSPDYISDKEAMKEKTNNFIKGYDFS